MSHSPERHGGWAATASPAHLVVAITMVLALLGPPATVHAGKLSWLDDLVQEVIVEAKAGGKRMVRGGDGARTEIRGAGRLFLTHEADETLEQLGPPIRRACASRPARRAAFRGPAPGPIFATIETRPA